jgi:sugar fermentation stimulation protein A
MLELLVPGARLILEAAHSPKRKHPFTLVAAWYKGKVIPLHSGKVNLAARELFLPRFFPGAASIIGEYRIGRSRFDFFVEEGETRHLIEVKGCTLVHNGVAMFPDAPTLRGTRHLRELAQLREEGYRTHLLVVIMHGDARRFLPGLHTDPDFAQALAEVQDQVALRAVSLVAAEDGSICPVSLNIPIDTTHVGLVKKNTGMYLLIVQLEQKKILSVGSLGQISFPPGYYVYTGSARGILAGRVARHLRKEKKKRWHIDYLTAAADAVTALPVYTEADLECSAANMIAGMADGAVNRFGCSDCSCTSHLYYFKKPPFHTAAFNDFILDLRHRDAFHAASTPGSPGG